MSSVEKIINQALFGYSDGHRLITSSIKLPSKDLFLLSAASDLASGVNLQTGDSYLTGLPLKESRQYALVRTWPAPEMSRPGCVWSHALLIDFRTLSTIVNLADLLRMFRLPQQHEQVLYSHPLIVPTVSEYYLHGDKAVITQLIASYYARLPLNVEAASAGDLEMGIIALWSQQWPKLRVNFSFQTARGSLARRSEAANFDLNIRSSAESYASGSEDIREKLWAERAADDAVQDNVTPLRRFLWRYGKDLLTARDRFRDLVEIYLEIDKHEALPFKLAQRIFARFPRPRDGITLKRDVLGISSAAAPLIPSVSIFDFFMLIGSVDVGELPHEEVLTRLERLSPSDVVGIARLLNNENNMLAVWSHDIAETLAKIADEEVVEDENLPPSMRTMILHRRRDLITDRTARYLSDDTLRGLVIELGDSDVVARISAAVVARDFNYDSGSLLRAAPIAIARACIKRASQNGIYRGWELALARLSSEVPTRDVLQGLSLVELNSAISLLRLKSSEPPSPDEWLLLIQEASDNLDGDQRIDFNAFLLLAALQQPSDASWQILQRVWPSLRPATVADRLPSSADYLLRNDLPNFHSALWWDLNKRVVLSMAKLNSEHPYKGSMQALGLDYEDQATFQNGLSDEERVRGRFWPWS